MSKPTFADRCTLSEQCLPDAPYRAMLTKLHSEMLLEIERLRTAIEQMEKPEPFMWVCNSLDKTEWETSKHKECEHCIPLYKHPAPAAPVQPAVPTIPIHRIADVESDEIADMRPGRAYREGWNDCRAAMLATQPAAPVQDKCFLCGERIESCTSTVCPKATPPAAQPAVPAEWLALAKEARRVAMEQTSKAAIPECGHFGAIAQDLDYLVGLMSSPPAAQSAPVPGRNHYEDGDVFERIAAMKKPAAQPAVPLTDEQWLDYLLKNASVSVVSIAAFIGESLQTRGRWVLRKDANDLRKLVEAAHGITEQKGGAA